MKKIIPCLFVIFLILSMNIVYAIQNNNSVQRKDNSIVQTEGKVVEIKKKAEMEIEEYNTLYGSEAYGMTAYVLNKIRIYSIPCCFVGIAVAAIYQYVLGIRRLDVKDKGFKLLTAFVTLLVICQVLPLVFAIVIRGWRS